MVCKTLINNGMNEPEGGFLKSGMCSGRDEVQFGLYQGEDHTQAKKSSFLI